MKRPLLMLSGIFFAAALPLFAQNAALDAGVQKDLPSLLETYKHLHENPPYIRPEDWRSVDSLIDWIIEKNKAGYQMVNSVQRLQEMKAFVRMSSGLDLKKYGWYGDGTGTNGNIAAMLADTTTIGVGLSTITLCVVSKPFMPGRRMSMEMTSGESFSRSASASSPVSTAATTSRRGSRPMRSLRNSRTTRESSTIITRILDIGTALQFSQETSP